MTKHIRLLLGVHIIQFIVYTIPGPTSPGPPMAFEVREFPSGHNDLGGDVLDELDNVYCPFIRVYTREEERERETEF